MKKINSKNIKYIRGEPGKSRHKRRKIYNDKFINKVNDICKIKNINFSVINGGSWKFKKNGIAVIWTPSTANLVVDNKIIIHVHDWKNVINEVEILVGNNLKGGL